MKTLKMALLSVIVLCALPAAAQNIVAPSPGAKVVGTPHNDVIVAHPGGSRLFGMAGNDKMIGQRGRDQIFGGPGDDLVHGGHGNDLLSGGPDADTFRLFTNDGTNQVVDFEIGDKVAIAGATVQTTYGYMMNVGVPQHNAVELFALRNQRTVTKFYKRAGSWVVPMDVVAAIHGVRWLSLPVHELDSGYRMQFLNKSRPVERFIQAGAQRFGRLHLGRTVRARSDYLDFSGLTFRGEKVLLEFVGTETVNVWPIRTAGNRVIKTVRRPLRIVGFPTVYPWHRLQVAHELIVDVASVRRVWPAGGFMCGTQKMRENLEFHGNLKQACGEQIVAQQ